VYWSENDSDVLPREEDFEDLFRKMFPPNSTAPTKTSEQNLDTEVTEITRGIVVQLNIMDPARPPPTQPDSDSDVPATPDYESISSASSSPNETP